MMSKPEVNQKKIKFVTQGQILSMSIITIIMSLVPILALLKSGNGESTH